MSDARFDRIDHTLDRLLTLAMDHAREIGEVKTDVRELRAELRDVRQDLGGIRRAVDSINESFTEHLGWHLGRT